MKEFSQFWDGYCSECMLNDKQSRMLLNNYDFFECEYCSLQMAIPYPGLQAVVLNFRGKHKFHSSKTYADKVNNSELLYVQTLDRFPFCEKTQVDAEDLKNFISQIK